jgi:hypothetical protein
LNRASTPALLYSTFGRRRFDFMAASNRRAQEEDEIRRLDPRILDRSVIAIPLLGEINKDENEVHAVIIDVNLDYDEGRQQAENGFET